MTKQEKINRIKTALESMPNDNYVDVYLGINYSEFTFYEIWALNPNIIGIKMSTFLEKDDILIKSLYRMPF